MRRESKVILSPRAFPDAPSAFSAKIRLKSRFFTDSSPESHRGSVFTFTFELKVPDQAVAIPAKKEAGTLKKAIRVLIVDDNAVNLLVAKKMSEKFGAHVTTAGSGMVAIDLVKTKEFDIVLMDIQMPDLFTVV